MITLAIVEDEAFYVTKLQEYLRRYEQEQGCRFDVRIFSDGEEILDRYPGDLDIILMDIQMRFVDGMTAAEKIREIDQEVILMFITNMEQYAVRGYAVDALDYMVKPVEYYSFSRKLDRAISRARRREQHYVTIRTPGGFRKVETSDLFYVESQGHDLHFHTRDGEMTMRGVMRETEENLKAFGFYRCNKGYLVNLARIEGVHDGCVILGGDMIPISRGKKKEFMEALAKYMSDVLT